MKRLITTFILSFFFLTEGQAVCEGSVETITIPDPVTGAPFPIEARVYRPLSFQFPVVFILPPIVGETPLDGALAGSLCLSGMGAYILDVLNDPPEAEEVLNLNAHEDGLIRSEVALDQYLQKLNADPVVKKSYGIIGASQGGIIASYLMGVKPELKASVIIAAGGNIPEILATSEQESVKSLRVKRFGAFNLASTDEYRALVSPYVTLDPLNVARNVAPNTILQFLLTADLDVPTKNQRELDKAWPSHEKIELNAPHLPGIIQATTTEASRIIKFLKDRL